MARVNERFDAALVTPPLLESFDAFNQTLVVVFQLQGWGVLDNTLGTYGVDSLTAIAADILHQMLLQIGEQWASLSGAYYGLEGEFKLVQVNPLGSHRGVTQELLDRGLVELPDFSNAFVYESFRCVYKRQVPFGVIPEPDPNWGAGAYQGNDYALSGGRRFHIPPIIPGIAQGGCLLSMRSWSDAEDAYFHAEVPFGWLHLADCRCPEVTSNQLPRHNVNAWRVEKNYHGTGVDFWVWDAVQSEVSAEEWECLNYRFLSVISAMEHYYISRRFLGGNYQWITKCYVNQLAADADVSAFLAQSSTPGDVYILPGVALNQNGRTPTIYRPIPTMRPHIPLMLGALLTRLVCLSIWEYLIIATADNYWEPLQLPTGAEPKDLEVKA